MLVYTVKMNYLVIGATRGIGREIANRLIQEKHNVFSISRSESVDLEVTSHQKIDMTEDDFTLELPEVLDGIVYCPGSIELGPFTRIPLANFRRDFEINVLGAVKCIQQCYKALNASNGASIVLFSTVAVSIGMNFHATVATAKGAVEALTRSLAAELAPKIRVNCVAPSLTDTPLAHKILATEQQRKRSENMHPLKRIATVDDMAAMACYLLKPDCAFITGQVFPVDGGLSSLMVK